MNVIASSQNRSIESLCRELGERAKSASIELACLSTECKNRWLIAAAEALEGHSQDLLLANQKDLEAAPGFGLTPAEIDRLQLTPSRIRGIADGMRIVAGLPDPVGEEMEHRIGSGGIAIRKIRVPLGVVFFIYESRPNVTADAAAICIKSGNAVILRGGKEAVHSSQAIVDLLRQTAANSGIPIDAIQRVETQDREAIDRLLGMNEWIDLAIPRGGAGLIRRVAEKATMPVIKHFDGNCHVYVDRDADLTMAVKLLENSKCQRMGVCNACESLLVHESIAREFLPSAFERLSNYSIEWRGDPTVCSLIPSAIPATEQDWGTEYLGPILSAKVVGSVEEAIEHINRYGSHHTDAIVSNNPETANRFTLRVDSSAVMVNASTRFNDGGEFGMGAEIGISTDKFHARGPCGLRELTSYKYIVQGNGQIRT